MATANFKPAAMHGIVRLTSTPAVACWSPNAGRNLNIVDGQANDSSDCLYQATKKGTFSSTNTTITASQESFTSVGSNFQGGLVSLHADNNVNIIGSHISCTQGVGITARNDLNIIEGRDTHSSSAGLSRTKNFEFLDRHLSQEKKVGNTLETRTDNAAASTITSGQGGIYLEGGNSVYLRGVQVNAAKDLTIKGGEVNIIAARNEAGLTVGNSRSKKSSVSSALHGFDGKSESTQDASVTSVRHVATLLALTDAEAAAVAIAVRDAAILIDRMYPKPGIAVWQSNGVPAGQAISHVHFHVAGTPDGGGTEFGPVEEISVSQTDEIARRLLGLA